jgi:phosphoglycolate phosphatase-like HAD superfamily hydrolase
MKKTAVIFDMDGTLADVSSIRHYLKSFDESKRRVIKHFDKFHDESINVPPHNHVVNAAQIAHMLGHAVLIVTARKHMWRHHTAWWLALHRVPSDMLMMRGNLDNRKDYLVKRDMLATIRKAYNVIHAWDDNPSIIKLWTEEGIPCTIVDGWDHG